MKKLALAVIATAFIAMGHAPVSAQQPPDPVPITPIPDNRLLECGESDGRTDVNGDGIADSCVEFYVAAAPPVVQQAPPVVVPPVLVPSTEALPRTGSSISPLLGMGAALLVGGGIIVVGTRRRSTATAS